MEAAKKTTQADLIKEIVDDSLYETNTAIPAIVDSFSASDKTVDVTPALQKTFEDGSKLYLPQIKGVPVIYPQAANFAIVFPIAVGDSVLLIFSQRSIERWKERGGKLDPLDVRKHDLSDAVAIPGLYKIAGGEAVEAGKVKIKYHDALIEIEETNRIKVSNDNGSIVLEADGNVDIDTGTNGAARLNDEIKSTVGDDAVFWSFILTLFTTFNSHVHPIGTPNTGPPTPLLGTYPTTLTGKITAGSNKVKIG